MQQAESAFWIILVCLNYVGVLMCFVQIFGDLQNCRERIFKLIQSGWLKTIRLYQTSDMIAWL